jgi:hypothetical protein
MLLMAVCEDGRDVAGRQGRIGMFVLLSAQLHFGRYIRRAASALRLAVPVWFHVLCPGWAHVWVERWHRNQQQMC